MDLKSVSPAARNGEARQEPEKRSANTAPAPTTQADIAASNSLAEHAGDVDTKSRPWKTFGNDGDGGADVDTKHPAVMTFGNDAAIGFIRVRKRKLKGGHPSVRERVREWPGYYSEHARESVSFDLVRAVRINGKPRHQFVLGLGSQKDRERYGPVWFWARAVYRMARHGLAAEQRQHLLAEMVRKGGRLPTIAQCEQHARSWPHLQAATNEFIQWLRAAEAPLDDDYPELPDAPRRAAS